METVRKNSKKGKGGRPQKTIRKESATGVRFTKSEYFIVQHKATKAGMKITAYIRVMAIKGKVVARLTETEKQQLKMLVGIANNINQLAKTAHQEGLLKAMLFFEKKRGELDQILKSLRS
jgi:hypothetical protein